MGVPEMVCRKSGVCVKTTDLHIKKRPQSVFVNDCCNEEEIFV